LTKWVSIVYLISVLLRADFNGDYERNVEAEILRRIEALPAGTNDPTLMKMLNFAQGRRPWLDWYIENFGQMNDPEVRIRVWQDESGKINRCDNLYLTFRNVLSLEDHTRTKYQFSGPQGRKVISPWVRSNG